MSNHDTFVLNSSLKYLSRANSVHWTGGCPPHAFCCSEFGFCRPRVSTLAVLREVVQYEVKNGSCPGKDKELEILNQINGMAVGQQETVSCRGSFWPNEKIVFKENAYTICYRWNGRPIASVTVTE